MVGAVVLVEADILGFNSHLAHIFYGVPRIDAQIGQDLIDLGGIDFDGPKVILRLPGKVEIFADQPPEHFQHSFDDRVKIEHFGCDGLLAGECQQLLRDFR